MTSNSSGSHRGRLDTTPEDTPTREQTTDTFPDRGRDRRPASPAMAARGEVADQQKQRFGGIKWGSAFFGWLTAIGTVVLLTVLVAAAAAIFGLSWTGGPGQTAAQLAQARTTVGITGAIIAAAVLFVAYYCGGYVAGRMARFSGVKQGIAVWIWTIVMSVLAAILIAVTDAHLTIPNGLPRLPMEDGNLTAAGIISGLIVLAVSLVGAILGGLAGMRFHRKVDRAGYDAVADHDTVTDDGS
jgi:amino acid transporter